MNLGRLAQLDYYDNVYSPVNESRSVKEYAFPIATRRSTIKCDEASPWLQKGSRCPVISSGELLTEGAGRLPSVSPGKIDPSPSGIADFNKKGISLAVDRRVALFFQQSILCYNMSMLTFSLSAANDQIGSAPKAILNTPHGKWNYKREAAHSSTIPTLIAFANDGSTPNGFVFLKGGSSYAQHNATIGMHESINGADELIDGKGQEKKLRHETIELLNRVAKGLNPITATYEFIEKFNGFSNSISRNLVYNDPRKHVLDMYQKKIGKIKQAFEDIKTFDYLLGISVRPGEKEHVLREIIYKKRFDVIRLQEVIESRIGKRIEDAKQGMSPKDASQLEYILLKEFSEDSKRQKLEKLFCTTATVFEDNYEKELQITGSKLTSLRRFRTTIDKLKHNYSNVINPLLRDLRFDFRELSNAEYSYRAGVFKDLRVKLCNWSQQNFCDHYQRNTGKEISRSSVSRMEELSRQPQNDRVYQSPINQRRKVISLNDAMEYAKTFNVDAGLFLPCFFTSK